MINGQRDVGKVQGIDGSNMKIKWERNNKEYVSVANATHICLIQTVVGVPCEVSLLFHVNFSHERRPNWRPLQRIAHMSFPKSKSKLTVRTAFCTFPQPHCLLHPHHTETASADSSEVSYSLQLSVGE